MVNSVLRVCSRVYFHINCPLMTHKTSISINFEEQHELRGHWDSRSYSSCTFSNIVKESPTSVAFSVLLI